MSEAVDFHVHYSDQPGRTVVEVAAANGLVCIGLVRRLEISSNLQEFVDFGRDKGIRVEPGVEWVARIGVDKAELIALGFDVSHPVVRKYFGVEEAVERNAEIARRQKAFLEEMGYVFDGTSNRDIETINKLEAGRISEKAIAWCRLLIGASGNKEKIESYLNSHASSWNEAVKNYGKMPRYSNKQELLAKFFWSELFALGKPGCFPTPSQGATDEIIRGVHDAGGIVIYSPEGSFSWKIFEKLADLGTDGVMGWHGSRLELDRQSVARIRKRGLLVLGGSDFDPEKNHWQLGVGDGRMYVSSRRLRDYLSYKSRYNHA